MALSKISPNRWRIKISVRLPGTCEIAKKQETFTGTKQEAELRQSEIIKGLREGSSLKVSRSISTFSDVLSIYTEKRNKKSAPDLCRIKKLNDDLGHLTFEQFPDRFERYLKELRVTRTYRGKFPSETTINRIIEMVRAAFNLMVELDIIEKNPISKARFPKAEEKPRDRYLNHEERLRLLNAIRQHRPYILPFVEYSIAVPCRKSELVTAMREQYNQFTNTVYIPDSKAGIPITKPIPASMVDYFRSIPTDCPFLFYRTDENGNYHALGDFKKAWKYCCTKAGLQNVRVHDLRHVAASDLYSSGIPERVIMDVAGWKTPMLSTYRHRDSLKSAQSINALFQKSEPALPYPALAVK